MSEFTDICEDIVISLQFHIDGLMASSNPDGLATDADAVVTYYQAIGICELLLDAEVDAFFHHLIRSAQTRKWLLERARGSRGYPDKVIRASNTRGLFGALAAFQWPLARDLAHLSPPTWLNEVEYEDDFCYAHFLHAYLLSRAGNELADILTRFETALEGGASARLSLCRALLSGDPSESEAAFSALLDEQAERLEQARNSSVYATEATFWPMSSIFIEGLAWLSLLESAGVVMAGEYPYCPSLARKRSYAPFEVTTFPGLSL